MFQRYKQLTHAPDCPIQEPKVLAPFYKQLEGMRDFFLNVSGLHCLRRPIHVPSQTKDDRSDSQCDNLRTNDF